MQNRIVAGSLIVSIVLAFVAGVIEAAAPAAAAGIFTISGIGMMFFGGYAAALLLLRK